MGGNVPEGWIAANWIDPAQKPHPYRLRRATHPPPAPPALSPRRPHTRPPTRPPARL
jgi:hypothetical protein